MSRRTSRRDALRNLGAITGTAGLTSIAGCSAILGGGDGGGAGSVTISSKSFTEQKLLGYLTVEALEENTDVEVIDEVGLGGSVTNFEALKSGESDLYWEYTGTAWATLPPKHEEVITDPEEIYGKVKTEFEDEYDITFLKRAPFNNTYVLLTREQWAADQDISSLSEFGSWLNDGNTDGTAVMNAEFQKRDDGWPGVTDHYGFTDSAGEMSVKNVSSSLTYQVVGQGDAVVGSGFNTNPKIPKFDLESLEDDEGFFPVYNPVPMVRQEVLDENGAIEAPLGDVADALSTETIRSLNRKVAIDGEDARDTAKNFLSSEDLI